MKILILEDEQRNAMRLIRLLNDIDTTFIIEGPLTNIKEAVDFFQSGKTTDLILADIRLTDGLSFEALKYAPATVPIIFTTAYDEYAVQAFKFNSFDVSIRPRACFFPLFSFLPLWLHYNLNPLCVQY